MLKAGLFAVILAFVTLGFIGLVMELGGVPNARLKTKVFMSSIEGAIRARLEATGEMPLELSELLDVVDVQGNEYGPFLSVRRGDLDAIAFKDGYGRKIRYQVKGNDFELRSAGDDLRFGTKDDIVVNKVAGAI